MINKAKRDKMIFALVGSISALIALVTTAVVILLVLKEIYLPMWFVLGVSAIFYYVSVFFTFSAIDRSTAIRVLGEIESLGTTDTVALAEKLGWTERATGKFVASCTKWGYISK